MHIGELAERTGLSLRTIRHYDEIGLLKPSGRSDGGFRLYTGRDEERLLLIRRMKPLGFSLEDMRELVRVVEEGEGEPELPGQVSQVLARYLEDARSRRARLQEQLDMADEFVARLERLSP